MKKFFLSVTVFAASAAYVAYQSMGGGNPPTPTAETSAVAITTPVSQSTSQAVAPAIPAATNQTQDTRPTPQTAVAPTPVPAPTKTPTPTPTPAPAPAPTPTPAPVTPPKPKGLYADGTYTGSPADAYYGTVQVQATISGGKITDVAFLQYPNDRRTSQYINSRAMPILRQEAIAAQSANVSGASGASETSAAFRESLADALSQAKS